MPEHGELLAGADGGKHLPGRRHQWLAAIIPRKQQHRVREAHFTPLEHGGSDPLKLAKRGIRIGV